MMDLDVRHQTAGYFELVWNKPKRSKAPGVPTDDEDILRRVLTEKYFEQGSSASQVQQLLAQEHSVVVTEKQLRDRIKRYGLQRRNLPEISTQQSSAETATKSLPAIANGFASLDFLSTIEMPVSVPNIVVSEMAKSSPLHDTRPLTIGKPQPRSSDLQSGSENSATAVCGGDRSTHVYFRPWSSRDSSWTSVVNHVPTKLSGSRVTTTMEEITMRSVSSHLSNVVLEILRGQTSHRSDHNDMSNYDLDMVERLANLAMCCGWLQAALRCLRFLLHYWLSRCFSGTDARQVLPLCRATTILNRIFLISPAFGHGMEDYKVWKLLAFYEECNLPKNDYYPKIFLTSIAHLALTCCSKSAPRHYKRASVILNQMPFKRHLRKILNDQLSDHWDTLGWALYFTPPDELSHSLMFVKRDILDQTISHIGSVILRPSTDFEDSVFFTALCDHTPSIRELECFQQRMLLALLCRSSWQPVMPEALDSVSQFLPHCIYQEWISGKSVFLTYKILCQMIQVRPVRPPFEWKNCRARLATAISILRRNMDQTTKIFFEVATQLDHNDFSVQRHTLIPYTSPDDFHPWLNPTEVRETFAERTFDIVCALMCGDNTYTATMDRPTMPTLAEENDPALNLTPGSSMSGLRSLKSIQMRLRNATDRLARGSSSSLQNTIARYSSISSLSSGFSRMSLLMDTSSEVSPHQNIHSIAESDDAMSITDP